MVYEKLQQARVMLQNKKLKKSGKNQYYDYFELADFLPAINEIFNELKLYSMFNLTREKAILRIVDTEAENQEVLFECPIIKAELKGCTAIQALGATITYLRRYLYMNALEIVESDYMDAKTVDELKKKDADIDIIEGLKALDTSEKAHKYFKEYEGKVYDKKKFKEIYTKVYLNLKKKEKENINE